MIMLNRSLIGKGLQTGQLLRSFLLENLIKHCVFARNSCGILLT